MPTPIEPTFVDTTAGRFVTLSWGDPSAASKLLLVHGFNQTAHSWVEVGPRLARDRHVVAFTQRGHGDSLRAPGHYGREEMTDDIARVADEAELSRFALLGMSMGAVHALCFAARHPSRVERLVIVDYAPRVQAGGVDKIKMMLMRTWSSFDEAVAEVHMFNPRRSEANIRERLRHTIREHEGRWRWKVDEAFATERRFSGKGDDMWAVVDAIECPTLLVRGGESDLLSEQAAEELITRLGDARLVTVEGAGHSVAGDQPAAFADAVGAFLNEG